MPRNGVGSVRPGGEARGEAAPPVPRDPADARRLERLLAHIDGHLAADLGVAVLAALVSMSASCFSRWFRARVGQSPHAYVVGARVERARRLLVEGPLPLVEIALAVGFTSQSCLTQAFRRKLGITPGSYRRKFSRIPKEGDPRRPPHSGTQTFRNRRSRDAT